MNICCKAAIQALGLLVSRARLEKEACGPPLDKASSGYYLAISKNVK
jgi:hypothetical protein